MKSDFLDNATRKLGLLEYRVSGREMQAIRGWEKSIQSEQSDIVFLGDSITYRGNWNEYFPDKTIYSIAVPGDSIEELLAKVDMVASLNPQKIFIMIGTNKISRLNYDSTIAKKHEELIVSLQEKCSATIYIQSILPARSPSSLNNERIDKANAIIKNLAENHTCVYINLHDAFSDENGELVANYTTDGCHINEAGYEVWVSIIRDLIYN